MELGRRFWRSLLPYSLIILATFLVTAMPLGSPGKALARDVDKEQLQAQKVDDEKPPTIADEKSGPANLESVLTQLIELYREHGLRAAEDFAGDQASR